MITLTKEQLADLLREAFTKGYTTGKKEEPYLTVARFMTLQEGVIRPLVHRSSVGHDDHGREVE